MLWVARWLAQVGEFRSECAVCCLLTAVRNEADFRDLGRAGVTLDYSIL